jgi:hypothetical protein
MQIGDMQTRQILWVARAEEALCLAADGRGSALPALAVLPESPTGAGRIGIIDRAIEFLIHAERPFCAIRLARAEGRPQMSLDGNNAGISSVRAFAREAFYRLRQGFRG